MSSTPRANRPGIAFAVVCLGTIAAPLDSAVNIAFPVITRAFTMRVEDIRWVIVSYVLTYASLMLVFGKLGDVFGYRRVFRTGLVIATVGFIACSSATSLATLLPGRVVQGIGIALTWSCAPALATSLYPESQRTRTLALFGAIIAVGTALGPIAGGLLVERFGWPVVFWARAPLVIAALAASSLIPGQPARLEAARRFDWLGAALLVAWLTAFLMAAARPPTPWPYPMAVALMGAGTIAFAVFVWHEARHPEPIIRPALFRDARFLLLNVASIAINLAGFAVMLLVPFYIARSAGLASGPGGLVLGLNAIGIIAGSWAAGRLARRVSLERIAVAGTVLSVLGLAGVGQWQATTPLVVLALTLLVQGTGLGLFQIAYADAVLDQLPRADRGVAGSLTIVTRTLGVTGAATGLTALHSLLEAHFLASDLAPASAFQTAFRWTFDVAAGAIATGLCLVVLLARQAAPKT